MTGRWFWPVVDAALNAVAEGIDLAARTLCPMDHTPPNLLTDSGFDQSRVFDSRDENAVALLKVDPQCGCGAGYATAAECPWCSPAEDKCSCPTVECPLRAEDICDEAEADEDYLYTTTWADYHAKKPDSSRAEGTQRADSSGEVGGHESPSPERPDVLRQVARQIWLYLDDGCRERLIVALALIEPPEPEGS